MANSFSSTANEIVRQAVAELAARLGVSPEQIELLSLQEVEWRDSSLGLPQPGMMYAQVMTPGYRIELRAADRRYRYHADARRVLFAGEV